MPETHTILSWGRRFNCNPYRVQRLIKVMRVAQRPRFYIERRNLGRAIIGADRWRYWVTQKKGYRILPIGSLPGMKEAITEARSIWDSASRRDVKARKAHLQDILQAGDLDCAPALVSFALSNAVLGIAAGYLDTLPVLRSIRIFQTLPTEGLNSSKMLHLDQDDFRQLKFLFYLSDVTEETGPLTFLPAEQGEWALRRIRWHGERIDDTRLDSYVNATDFVSLTGEAGTGITIDTNHCPHFGGRLDDGNRGLLVFNFTSAFSIADYPPLPLDQTRFENDPIRRRVLNPSS